MYTWTILQVYKTSYVYLDNFFPFPVTLFYCSAWPMLKLNTKKGLHTTHYTGGGQFYILEGVHIKFEGGGCAVEKWCESSCLQDIDALSLALRKTYVPKMPLTWNLSFPLIFLNPFGPDI